MMNMEELLSSIIRYAFGNRSKIVEYHKIVDKAYSLAIQVVCDQFDKPLF